MFVEAYIGEIILSAFSFILGLNTNAVRKLTAIFKKTTPIIEENTKEVKLLNKNLKNRIIV